MTRDDFEKTFVLSEEAIEDSTGSRVTYAS